MGEHGQDVCEDAAAGRGRGVSGQHEACAGGQGPERGPQGARVRRQGRSARHAAGAQRKWC